MNLTALRDLACHAELTNSNPRTCVHIYDMSNTQCQSRATTLPPQYHPHITCAAGTCMTHTTSEVCSLLISRQFIIIHVVRQQNIKTSIYQHTTTSITNEPAGTLRKLCAGSAAVQQPHPTCHRTLPAQLQAAVAASSAPDAQAMHGHVRKEFRRTYSHSKQMHLPGYYWGSPFKVQAALQPTAAAV